MLSFQRIRNGFICAYYVYAPIHIANGLLQSTAWLRQLEPNHNNHHSLSQSAELQLNDNLHALINDLIEKRARVQVGRSRADHQQALILAPCRVCSLISGAHYSRYLVRQLSEFVSVAFVVDVAVDVAVPGWRAFPFQLVWQKFFKPNYLAYEIFLRLPPVVMENASERSWVRQGRANPADLHLADREEGVGSGEWGRQLGRHSSGINGSCLRQSSSISSRSFGHLSAAAALPVDCQFPRAPAACCLLRAPVAATAIWATIRYCAVDSTRRCIEPQSYIELHSVAHFTILNKRWVANKNWKIQIINSIKINYQVC